MNIMISVEIMGTLHDTTPLCINIHLLQIQCTVNSVVLWLTILINVMSYMYLQIVWIDLHSG
jgi:hypothetical protein